MDEKLWLEQLQVAGTREYLKPSEFPPLAYLFVECAADC